MININNAVQFQHLIWDRVMKHANIVVDATCGNGHDLLYLAERAKKGCHLYGIDIQMKAINSSQELLQSNDIAQDVSLTFIHDSHDRALANQLKDEVIDLMIFNLGYLPGGDHQVITKPHQTIDAINEGLENYRSLELSQLLLTLEQQKGLKKCRCLNRIYQI